MSAFDSTEGLIAARELIPARVRRGLYACASLAGYVLAATAVGLTAGGVEVPSGVTVSLAVLGALMGPLGQLAATNTSTASAGIPIEVDEDEVDDDYEPDGVEGDYDDDVEVGDEPSTDPDDELAGHVFGVEPGSSA